MVNLKTSYLLLSRDKTVRDVLEKNPDWGYLKRELESAVSDSFDGSNEVVNLTKSLREFSHPESAEIIRTDLEGVINNTLKISKNKWKNIAEIQVDISDKIKDLKTSPSSLKQCLLNLIINASQAIQAKGNEKKGKIEIRADKEKDITRIYVIDNGIGMSEDIQDKIFDPFFTTKKVGEGTGQGLSIVRNIIVKKLGGRLEVKSSPGSGTSFIIELPETLCL